jgi:hypothetical protein
MGKTLSLDETIRWDAASATILYVGFAYPDALESEARWKIFKVDTTAGNKLVYPNGDDSYIYVWNSRATYTYP